MLEFIHNYSYFGLFVILFIEEAGVFLPIPGDIFIAVTAALPQSNYLLVVATVMIATLTGSTVLFFLSRTFGHMLLVKFGRFIKLTPKRIKKVEKWFAKYGGAAIVIGRVISRPSLPTPLFSPPFFI